MLIPDRLRKGDTIAVVAPSSPVLDKDLEYIEASKKMLESVRFECCF